MRIGLVVLCLAGGLGIGLYLVLLGISADDEEARSASRRPRPTTSQATAFGIVVLGLLLFARQVGLWFGDSIVWPFAMAGVGSAIIWTGGDESRRERWNAQVRRLPLGRLVEGAVPLPRLLAGVLLVALAMTTFLSVNRGFTGIAALLVAIAVGFAGLAVIFAPGVARLLRQLGSERRERIRQEERAEVARHLHDSVLQTLTLIQRTSDADAKTALARVQERELRAWLYGNRGPQAQAATLREALDDAAGDVEAASATNIEVVVVGDASTDGPTASLVAAAREAMLNAAKHAGVATVSVYAEATPSAIDVWVRDRGRGFELGAVADDRHGIRDSIVARLAQVGGVTGITTRPGEGTEVHLHLPRPPAPEASA